VRGVEYGWLDLELPASTYSQAELQMTGEVVANLLAQAAEEASLWRDNDRLRAEARDLSWSLKIDKLLSRAAGIVMSKRDIGSRAAIEWLREESLRLRLPLWQMSERLIEGQMLARTFQEDIAQKPLGRTA
jgi:hypothetical protein